MTTKEMRVELDLPLIRVRNYVAVMLEGGVIYRHKSNHGGSKKVYRHCVAFDRDQIDGFLAKLEAQFAKPLGSQRQAIRMPELTKKKPTQRTRPMNDTQKKVLEHMRNMFDFIAAHPGCTMMQMCAHYKQAASTLRTPLHHLRDGGYLEVTEGARSKLGQSPNAYTVSDKGRPNAAPQRKKKGERVAKIIIDPNIKQVIKKAKQLGMAPYADLPAGFFARSAA